MSEKPILFSTPMVEAILDGRKTMTRRIFQRVINKYAGYRNQCAIQSTENPEAGIVPLSEKEFYEVHSPYFKGDILWVRESWAQISWPAGTTAREYEFVYRATPPKGYPYKIKWAPSIHLMHNHARIFLEVTNMRVERLQDITEEDAKAEGMTPMCARTAEECRGAKKTGHGCNKGCQYFGESYLPQFIITWDKLDAKRGFAWKKNPLVWVYEFRRIEK